MRLGGKVAIVTGGARHIGAVYARKFASEGAAVVIADILDGTMLSVRSNPPAAERWR